MSWRGDVYGADWSRVQGWHCSLVPKAPGEEALLPPWEPWSVLILSGLGAAPTLWRVICLLQDVGHLHKPSQRHLG